MGPDSPRSLQGGLDLVLQTPPYPAPWRMPHKQPQPPVSPDSLERRFFIMTMALRNMRISTSLWHREGTA